MLHATEIRSVRDVINQYTDTVRTGDIDPNTPWLRNIDPIRPELEHVPVLTLSTTEHTTAQRGIWRHLLIVYRGAQRKSKNYPLLSAAKAACSTLYELDGYESDSINRMQTLRRSFDNYEEEWLGLVAITDQHVLRQMAELRFARESEKTGEWHQHHPTIRNTMIGSIETHFKAQSHEFGFYRFGGRAEQNWRRLDARRKFWREQIGSLALDQEAERGSLVITKLAEQLLA